MMASPICEEVTKHPSYHGSINQRQAEAVLTQIDEPGNHYITRYSKAKESFMISARRGRTWSFLHKKVRTKIESDHVVYKFRKTKRTSFNELLNYLSDKKIGWSSFRGIGVHVPASSHASGIEHSMDSENMGNIESTSSTSRRHAIPTWKFKQISVHPSFHGPITWKEAEDTLKNHGGLCYLIRHDNDGLMLSVMQREFNGKKAFREFEIVITRDLEDYNKVSFEIRGTEYRLDSLTEMLHFYENVALSDRSPDGIGVCVARRNHHLLPSPGNPAPGNFPPEVVPKIVRPLDTQFLPDHQQLNQSPPEVVPKIVGPLNAPPHLPNHQQPYPLDRSRDPFDRVSQESPTKATLSPTHSHGRSSPTSTITGLLSTASSPLEMTRRGLHSNKSSPAPSDKTRSRPNSGVLDFFDEPQVSKKRIEDHPSFWSNIKSKEDAVSLIHQYGGNCYITSQMTIKGENYYVLSVAQRKRGELEVKHFELKITEKSCKVRGKDAKKFDSVGELLSYYSENPITEGFDGIGEHLEHDSENRLVNKALQRPVLKTLTLIKWKADGDRKARRCEIIPTTSSKWRDIAPLIGISHVDIDNIRDAEREALRCNQKVFGKWLEKGGNESYCVTWEGLCELLDDVQFGQITIELKNALASKGVHVDYPKNE